MFHHSPTRSRLRATGQGMWSKAVRFIGGAYQEASIMQVTNAMATKKGTWRFAPVAHLAGQPI